MHWMRADAQHSEWRLLRDRKARSSRAVAVDGLAE
jgi:hypothetical protein